MTNRERYITKRNEYDLMMEIEKNLPADCCSCVIELISGSEPSDRLCYRDEWEGKWEGRCNKCYQKWLNEESED